MSQWGAQGAALQGLTWSQIIAFYFPGTTLASQGDPALRIGITADTDGATEVVAAPGQTLRVGTDAATPLPTSPTTTAWHVTRRGAELTVSQFTPPVGDR